MISKSSIENNALDVLADNRLFFGRYWKTFTN